ncbi:MAG: hypothetical protein OXC62_08535 [Aestuariivita sp.]|nr:hypothetical protein [Aestuariivita sp.]
MSIITKTPNTYKFLHPEIIGWQVRIISAVGCVPFQFNPDEEEVLEKFLQD